MFYPTSSSFVASLATSGPTMGRSLWPRLFRSGSQRSEPTAPGRMVTSRVSTHACEMNCSMVKYSTRCVRPKSSSKVGGATSTQSGRMNRWTTSHQHRKCSCPPSLRGRLRYVDRLRRPRWRNGQLSTNIPPGPLDGGRSLDTLASDRRDGPELGKVGPDHIDHRSLLADKQMARAMERQTALLLGGRGRDEPHVHPADSLADGLRVGGVVLLPFDVGFNVGRRHQPHRVAERLKLARPMMR